MRNLDFILIGVQKGGTTSLWRHLSAHPRIWMPAAKEAPFFCMPGSEDPGTFAAFMDAQFASAPEGALLGKATPQYMMGLREVGVERIASRIATELPDVRLIALLRNPIERAVSQYRMSVRRGWEQRSFETAATAQLDSGEGSELGWRSPTETNSYVAQGEYGRILEIYRSHFPASRLLIAFSDDLAGNPGGALDDVLRFLGLEAGFRPEGIGKRHFRGGMKKRLDRDAEEELLDYLKREVLPHMQGDANAHRRAFAFFFETWNVIPEADLPPLSSETRVRLEEHFRTDAERLQRLGIDAPWVADWNAARVG